MTCSHSSRSLENLIHPDILILCVNVCCVEALALMMAHMFLFLCLAAKERKRLHQNAQKSGSFMYIFQSGKEWLVSLKLCCWLFSFCS